MMKLNLLLSLLCFITLPFNAQAISPKLAKTSASEVPIVKQVNLNTADVKTLSKSIKGIGKKRAEAIIKYREAHGKFKTVNDLAQVPGFGPKFVNTHADEIKNIFTL